MFVVFAIAILSIGTYAQDLERLAEQIARGSFEQKRSALAEIRNLRSEAASRIAVRGLSDGNELVRVTAIGAVVFMPEPEVWAALFPFLKVKSEFIRTEAVYALGEARSTSALNYLSDAGLKDRSPSVRSAAAAALGKVGEEAALASLAAVLNRRPNSDDELLRRAAARAVGQIAEKSRFGRASQATPTSFLPEKYKIQTVDAYTPKASSAFSEPLRTLLRVAANGKETDDTRREAAFALGAIGDNAALPFLRANVGSTDTYLAEICREALLKISQ